jgi:hypothetical protein
MTYNNTRILDCLKNIKGSGSFVSSSTAAFIFPGLEGDDMVSYHIRLTNRRQKR